MTRAVILLALLACTWPAFGQCAHMASKHEEEGTPHEPDPPGTTFAASRVALLNWLRLDDLPGANAAANDVWGYASASGREYALLGLRAGTAFIEVTNPESPVVVDYHGHPPGCCSDIKVYDTYAYVVTEGGGGMQVFDLALIDAGIVTLVTTFTDAALTQAHNLAINTASGFAYICGALNNPSSGGLFMVDVRVPHAPVFAGAWADNYVHDAHVVTYEEGPYAGREIAFTFCGSSNFGLQILDVTDKLNPVVLSRFNYPNQRYTHQGWLSTDRRYLYIDDEFDEIYYGVPTSTYVVEVADLANPRFVRTFTTGLPSIDHNLYVLGDFIFQANYTSGMRIFYAPNRTYIHEVGFFDTHAADNHPVFHGAWTAYPYLPSGIVLVSDMANGLFVLDPSEAIASAPSLPVAPTATFTVVFSVAFAVCAVIALRRSLRLT